MKRRALLAALGSAPFAGCGSFSGRGTVATQTDTATPTETPAETPTPTATPTDTPTATETATPTPEPKILYVNLISDWKEYGDVVENRIEAVASTDTPTIGARLALVCSGDREVRWRNVTTVQDDNGETVASRSAENEAFTNSCNSNPLAGWEQAFEVYYDNDLSAEWPVGRYEAMVRIDDYYGQMSVRETTEFEVASGQSST